jgi:hypothetical protein
LDISAKVRAALLAGDLPVGGLIGKSAGGSILGFGATVAIASGPAERKTRVRTAARPVLLPLDHDYDDAM